MNDTTPQLGGNLDVNGNEITSASNGNVVVNPDGTGTIELEAATNVTGNMEITGDLVPEADNTRDLGSGSLRFAEIHGNDIHAGDMVLDNTNRQKGPNDVDGTRGRWRIQEGNDSLFIINEVDGTQYRFVLEEV